MRTLEEIEAIRAERAAKRAQPHLAAIYLGVEYPEGREVWGWSWGAQQPERIGFIVSVNPNDRAEVAVAKNANHRRWSNTPREMRKLLGVSAFPSRALVIEWRRADLLAERTRRVDSLARLDREIASLVTLPTTVADVIALRTTDPCHPLFAAEDDARRELAAQLVSEQAGVPEHQPPDAVRLDAQGRTEEAHRVRLTHALATVREMCQPIPFDEDGLANFSASIALSRAPSLRCKCRSRCSHRFTEVGSVDPHLTIGQWRWLSSDAEGPDHHKIVAGTKIDPAVAEDRDLTPTGMRQLFAQAPEWARYVQTAMLGEKKRQPPPRTYPYAGPGSPLDE